jgi:uncharacterized protein (DUF302 family)
MRALILTLLTLLGSGVQAAGPPLLETSSPYSLEETVDRVKHALSNQNLRLLREQELAGPPTGARTLYFCDFDLLERAYRINTRIRHDLPCRITVSQRSDGVVLSALNPEYAAHAAGLGVSPMCSELKAKILELMWEATL